MLMCDHDRCWRRAVVYIPEVGEKCSAHAWSDWNGWPAERYAEITDRLDSPSSGGAARGGGADGQVSPGPFVPVPSKETR